MKNVDGTVPAFTDSRTPPPPLAGASYYHDNDNWDDGEVAAVGIGAAAVGAMAGYAAGKSSASTSPPSAFASLPCVLPARPSSRA